MLRISKKTVKHFIVCVLICFLPLVSSGNDVEINFNQHLYTISVCKWDIHFEKIYLSTWAKGMIARIIYHFPLSLLPFYLFKKGHEANSKALMLLGVSAHAIVTAGLFLGYFFKLIGMTNDLFSAVSMARFAQSQPWEYDIDTNGSSPFSDIFLQNYWYNQYAPAFHYHLADNGRSQIWVNREVSQLGLEISVFFIVREIRRRAFFHSQYFYQPASAPPVPSQTTLELSGMADEVLMSGPAALTENTLPTPVQPSEFMTQPEPDLGSLAGLPASPPLPKAMKKYITANVFFKNSPDELLGLRKEFMSMGLELFRQHTNQYQKVFEAITGGAACLLHHMAVSQLQWPEYWSQNPERIIVPNDIDIYSFGEKQFEELSNSFSKLGLTHFVRNKPVLGKSKMTVAQPEGIPVYSYFWGIKDDYGHFITLFGVDIIKKMPTATEAGRVTSLPDNVGAIVPVMNFDYELDRLEEALSVFHMGTEHDKYLHRLAVLTLAQGKAVINSYQKEECIVSSKLTDLIVRYKGDIQKQLSNNFKARNIIRRLLNGRKKQLSAEKTDSPFVADVYSPPSEQHEDAYGLKRRMPLIKKESIKPDIERHASSSVKKRIKSRSLMRQRKGTSYQKYIPLTMITAALSVLITQYISGKKTEDDRGKGESGKAPLRLHDTTSLMLDASQKFHITLNRWQENSRETGVGIDCSQYAASGIRKLCTQFYQKGDFLSLSLLAKLARYGQTHHMAQWRFSPEGKVIASGFIDIKYLPRGELKKLVQLNLAFALNFLRQQPLTIAMKLASQAAFLCGYFPGSDVEITDWYIACLNAMMSAADVNHIDPKNQERLPWLLLQKSLKVVKQQGQFIILLPDVRYQAFHKAVASQPYLMTIKDKKLFLTSYEHDGACSAIRGEDYRDFLTYIDVDSIKAVTSAGEKLCPPAHENITSVAMLAFSNDYFPKPLLWAFVKGQCIPFPWSTEVCSDWNSGTGN